MLVTQDPLRTSAIIACCGSEPGLAFVQPSHLDANPRVNCGSLCSLHGQFPRRRGISAIVNSCRRRANGTLPDVFFVARIAPPPTIYGGDQVKRREFISLLGGAAVVWPLAARAQPSKVARIGALYIGLADAESFKKELREGLRELGYVEGQNIAFEFRSAEGKLDRLPELAAELVRLKVDVIVALYVPCALAAKQATREIPIVIIAADPVETGIVASLARPGGNITGVSLMSAVLVGKCVELFRDMLASYAADSRSHQRGRSFIREVSSRSS